MSSTILSERGVRTLPLAADRRGRDGGGRRVIGAAWELCVGTQFLHHSGQLGFMRSLSNCLRDFQQHLDPPDRGSEGGAAGKPASWRQQQLLRRSERRRLPARELPARELQARELQARELQARELQARELQARELQARELQARELQARELQARELSRVSAL
ncbi:hypothetical protein D5F01_LYC20099 [Larimichthys crocea]|uniref:Uncharacterized protein n=1 Tax=Larimichthys crocea TaxID=215358 RepID=A0A6G0HPJ7_LARCR|nr:hypothetical protein D5F01_LYC20099 [Larimichthys crocea]